MRTRYGKQLKVVVLKHYAVIFRSHGMVTAGGECKAQLAIGFCNGVHAAGGDHHMVDTLDMLTHAQYSMRRFWGNVVLPTTAGGAQSRPSLHRYPSRPKGATLLAKLCEKIGPSAAKGNGDFDSGKPLTTSANAPPMAVASASPRPLHPSHA